ncbi:MAG: extracellular solute-binding protein [Lachnospiraceae bacterium]|nr:extracellular solute-binding protein [Lachnospiraceae bacterium]
MKMLKKLTAMILIGVMALNLAACGSSSEQKPEETKTGADVKTNEGDKATVDTGDTTATVKQPRHEGDTPRTIRIGTWYDIYYDSTHTDIHDDPSVSDEELAQMNFDALKKVEEKYNVRLEYVNLTYAGVQESINTSVLAGKPDCDIYLTEPSFGIPAVANGYATNLAEVLPANEDILTDQNYLTTININGIDGTYFMLPVGGESVPTASYVLSFNKKMLDDAGLENPNALYERGEWTWDKWREYLLKLTKDTDGDGVTDVYGFGSRFDWLFEYLNMSNGTAVASGKTENLSSKEVGETLEFIYNMYNVDHVANPWNEEDFDYNMSAYVNGEVACWFNAAWIVDTNKDYDKGLEEIWVPMPIGPSGNKETNARKNSASGAAYIIPTGVEDPYLVYSVFRDYKDYYGDDFEQRDFVNDWWHDNALTEDNYNVMYYCGEKTGVDLWNALGVEYQFPLLLKGEQTAAQFQETNKQLVQTALNNVFK